MFGDALLARTTAMSGAKSAVNWHDDKSGASGQHVIWIDGVGGFLLCWRNDVVVGQAAFEPTADLLVVGDLSRQALSIRRSGGDYLLQPLQEIQVDGESVSRPQLLRDAQTISVGARVRLRFSKPSPLSSTARIDLASHHRWKPAVDGVLLVADSCIFGPRLPSHVHCPHWMTEVLLYKHAGNWSFRSASEMSVNGRLTKGPVPLAPGIRICGEDFSFSIE